MITNLNQSIQLEAGGRYIGDTKWGESCSVHTNNAFKLYYITEGEITIGNNKEYHQLEANGLYLINGYKMTHYSTKKRFIVNWIHFELQSLVIQHILRSSQPLYSVINLPQSNISTFEEITNEFNVGSTISDYNIQSLNAFRLQTIIQNVVCEVLNFDNETYNEAIIAITKIAPAIKYMDENFESSIKIEDLSEMCGLSSNYFHKMFSDLMHVTPYNYILKLRMNRAITLILKHEHSIKEISYILGFCTDAHFSVVFKKYFNITPKKFQNSNKNIFLG